MKWMKVTLLLFAVLFGVIAASDALANGRFRGHHFHGHHHARIGVFVGVPLFAPWYYPPPYYYYPPPVVAVPSSPPTYVERGDEERAEQPSYWYYCNDPEGYYPYVKECPGGWKKVLPRPPS